MPVGLLAPFPTFLSFVATGVIRSASNALSTEELPRLNPVAEAANTLTRSSSPAPISKMSLFTIMFPFFEGPLKHIKITLALSQCNAFRREYDIGRQQGDGPWRDVAPSELSGRDRHLEGPNFESRNTSFHRECARDFTAPRKGQ